MIRGLEHIGEDKLGELGLTYLRMASGRSYYTALQYLKGDYR